MRKRIHPVGLSQISIAWIVLCSLATQLLGQPVLFVDADAPPGGDGQSWSTAFHDLQDALDLATADPAVEEVWVAEGEYLPDRGTIDRTLSFIVRAGLDVYGGFSGIETQREQRDPAVHITTLSGLIDPGEDLHTLQVVVIEEGAGTDTILDGLVITRGRAIGPRMDRTDLGGGLYAMGAAPTVRRCRFVDNEARYQGAGAYAGGGSLVPVFEDCVFERNAPAPRPRHYATLTWGIGLRGGAFSGTGQLTNCRFTENTALRGGAVYCDLVITLLSCVLEENEALEEGGAIRVEPNSALTARNCRLEDNHAALRGGAISVTGTRSEIVDCVFLSNESDLDAGAMFFQDDRPYLTDPFEMTGCAFRGNSAGRDGGACFTADPAPMRFMHCDFVGNWAQRDGGAIAALAASDFHATVTMWNSTVAANAAAGRGGGVHIRGLRSTAVIENTILWENTDSRGTGEAAQITNIGGVLRVGYSDVQGWTGLMGGEGNFAADPLFTDLAGLDQIVGTEDDDIQLASGSPCTDAGDNEVLPPDVQTDRIGNQRYMDDPAVPDSGRGSAPIIDLGPYEIEGRTFLMHAPIPGVAGQLNVFSVSGAPPHTTVHFLWGVQPGRTPVPGCSPGTVIDIQRPQILGTAFASIRGNAELGVVVPSPASGRTVYLQALQLDECVLSSVLEFTFE